MSSTIKSVGEKIDNVIELLGKMHKRIDSIQEDVANGYKLDGGYIKPLNDDKAIKKLREIGKWPYPQ